MYSAAELDVPPPPDFSPKIARSFAHDNDHGRDQPRTFNLTKTRPPVNRQSTYNTDSTKSSSITSLDTYLCSFQPSLSHIAPVLSSLGIRSEDHLRAVARLSEETRDREVREVALQKGMTVVEWAMLLDRIRSV